MRHHSKRWFIPQVSILKCLSLLVLSCFIGLNAWAKITAEVEPTQVHVGESFRVTFSSDKAFNDGLPDFSRLEKAFTILGSGKRSQVSMINNQVKTTVQWVLTLTAKRAGQQLIPPIRFGHEESQPLYIQVTKQSATENKSIFLNVSVDKKNPYVQSQVTYTVKLFYAKRLSRGNLEPPRAEGADIMPLGKSRTYQARKNGRLYQVLEQNFAVFPQKSGSLTIQSPILTGSIDRSNLTRIDQLFDDIQRPVHLSAADIDLKVAAIPKSFKGDDWLPSPKLSLSQSWQGDLQKAQVGEPITRTITLKALGVTSGQLPDLKFEGSESLKVYPETPKSKTKLNGTELVSTKIFKVTYIPSASGKSNLPALSVKWWDLKNNRQSVAILKGQTLQVLASSGASKARPAKSDKHELKFDIMGSNPTAKGSPPQAEGHGVIWWLVLAFLVIWLLTLWAWRLSHKRTKDIQKPPSKAIIKTLTGQKRALKKACMAGDAAEVRRLLISMADKRHPKQAPHHLDSLKEQASPALAKELERLEAALYGQGDAWDDGAALWQAYLEDKPANKKRDKASNPDPLEPLNLD